MSDANGKRARNASRRPSRRSVQALALLCAALLGAAAIAIVVHETGDIGTPSAREHEREPKPLVADAVPTFSDRTVAAQDAPTPADASAASEGRSAIALRVRDAAGAPLAGVSGCVHPFAAKLAEIVEPKTFVTDPMGCAELPVSPGRWIMRIAADPNGYRKVIVAPHTVARVDYVVQTGLVVLGSVKDTSGAPIADAAIELTATGADSVRLPVCRTGGDGRFRLAIADKECIVVARADGDATASTEIYVEHLTPGQEVRTTLVLQAGTALAGIVRDQRGAPVADCLLTASSLAAHGRERLAPGAESARSAADGSFIIARLTAGPNVLLADALGYLDWKGAAETKLGTTVSCVVELQAAGTLLGLVRSSDGAPLADAVVVGYSGPRQVGSARSDAQGAFELPGLPLGEVLVWAFHKAGGWGRIAWIAETTPRSTPTVVLQPGVDVRGRCIDPTGQGVAGASGEVQFVDADGRRFPWVARFETDVSGYFTAANADQQATRHVLADKSGYSTATGRFAANVDVSLTMQPVQLDVRLTGRVVTPAGKALEDADVIVSGRGLDGSPATVTTADGHFAVEGLPRGDLWITLKKAGFARTRLGPVSGAGGHQDVGDLTILRGGTVSLRAMCPNAKSLRGNAYLRDDAGAPFGDFAVLDGIGVSGAVPPGTYQLSVALPDCEARTLPVNVLVDAQTELVVELRPGAKIRLVCVVPPAMPAEVPLTGTISRKGEVVYRFQRAASPSRRHELNLTVGDGPCRLHVAVGKATAVVDCDRADVPVIAGVRSLTVELGGR
ncbi:MAG: carboxypeptidase regulatory-like domain-containing protein [Planctomycetota bacterium]